MNQKLDKIPRISRLKYIGINIVLLVVLVYASVSIEGLSGNSKFPNYNPLTVGGLVIAALAILYVTIGRMKDIGWNGKRLWISLLVLTGYGYFLSVLILAIWKPRSR